MKHAVSFLLVMGLAACGPAPQQETVRLKVEAAPDLLRPSDTEPEPLAALSGPVEDKIAEIRIILGRNSLSQLSRLAQREPAFVSNFAGEGHRTHWDLLRRTGFDPLARLGQLLDGPYGVKTVGEEAWYVWPDLAALEPDELLPERLSFSDRARLLELVGETGIARVRDGQGYPGVRTAFAEDGRWLYYVHETEDEQAEE
ncbi:MAG: hypothetical protein AAGA24_03825 [Pseudomonadota bacterium]